MKVVHGPPVSLVRGGDGLYQESCQQFQAYKAIAAEGWSSKVKDRSAAVTKHYGDR